MHGWEFEVPLKGFVTGLSGQEDEYVAFGKIIFSRTDQSFKMEFWSFMINSEQKSHHPHPVDFCSVTEQAECTIFIYI